MKKILFTCLILVMTLTYAEAADTSGESGSMESQLYTKPSRDWITVSNWAWDYVEKYFDTELMPSSLYHLTDYTVDITREQFCELIVPILVNKRYVNNLIFEEQFSDCDNAEVLTLAKLGIISGTGETTFEPQKKLTREEAATILYRAATYTNICDNSLKTNVLYNDDSDVSSWAKAAVYKMNDCDIMSGVGENKFSPKSTYSIEQAVKTALQIYNIMPSNEGIYPNAQNKEENLQPDIDFVIATWYNGYYAIQYNDKVYISKTNLKSDSLMELNADVCFGMNCGTNEDTVYLSVKNKEGISEIYNLSEKKVQFTIPYDIYKMQEESIIVKSDNEAYGIYDYSGKEVLSPKYTMDDLREKGYIKTHSSNGGKSSSGGGISSSGSTVIIIKGSDYGKYGMGIVGCELYIDDENNIYVPIEEFTQGADFDFFDKGTIYTVKAYGKNISFDMDLKEITIGTSSIKMSADPITKDGEIYLALADVEKAFGFTSSWDADKKTLTLTQI